MGDKKKRSSEVLDPWTFDMPSVESWSGTAVSPTGEKRMPIAVDPVLLENGEISFIDDPALDSKSGYEYIKSQYEPYAAQPDWLVLPGDDPWSVDIGDARLDPYVTVDIGTPDILGPNEFLLDDGTKESWDFGPIEIRDPWK